MRSVVLAAILGCITPITGTAQTEENLQQAISLYEGLQIEQARDLLLVVISPNSPFEVSQTQRVLAYIYLGASYASLNNTDSANIFFLAAIERNPFVDLDPQSFTDVERQVFGDARQLSFRVGARPIEATEFDPRTEALRIQTLTTHSGQVQVFVNHTQRQLRLPVFAGEADGLRQFNWSGSLPQGGLAPPGVYELVVTGVSSSNQRSDSTSVLFRLEHQFDPLEDTLPRFRADQLLPERLPPSVARNELFMGLGVAAAALILPSTVGNRNLGSSSTLSISVATLGLGTGLFAYLRRQATPEMPRNMAENARREAARQAENVAIRRRNANRIARTIIRITPVAGSSG